MNLEDIEKTAASKAMNRTSQMFEEEFELELDKEDKKSPSIRRQKIIERIREKMEEKDYIIYEKQKGIDEIHRKVVGCYDAIIECYDAIIECYDEIDRFTEETIIKWYKVGARRGAIEMVRALIDEGVINDTEYRNFIEGIKKLEWSSSINYTKIDGSEAKITPIIHNINSLFLKVLKIKKY